MRLNVKQILFYTGGRYLVEPIDAGELLQGISWDSREIEAGCLYVALPGERVDGHAYVGAALRAGARAALVTDRPDEAAMLLAREMGAAIIEVPNTAHAITDIAREWRHHLKGRVIGLTGSTGKTTTKNLVRDVVAAAHTVVATKANQNNELGVPKTLLSADPETEVVVVEMGMRGRGQIEELCEFVRPDWGVITNIGESHIELLGSRENIARAKAELLAALPAAGVAILNADDAMTPFAWELSGLASRGGALVCFDGSGDARPLAAAADDEDALPAAAAVWAEDVSLDDQGRPHFTLCACGFDAPADADEACETHRVACALNLRGMHNVANACAAAAVGCRLGMSLELVAEALAEAEAEAGRQEVLQARGGFTVVNDAYNANPDSMRASLKTFCALAVPGKRIAVLGDMGELGDYAPACHAGIGELAATLPLDRLVCVGELASIIADAAEKAGMDPHRIVRATALSEVLGDLDVCVEPGDAVLVKASHFMGLERVVEGLVN